MRFVQPVPSLSAAAACFVLMALAAPGAHAQSSDADRATARSLGGEGQQALDARDYKTAEDRFRRAESLVHAPTLMLGLARALAGEGKYVEAQETYNRIVREGVAPTAPDPFRRALADAKKEVEGVSPKIGGVTITIRATSGTDVPAAKVLLDGAPVNAASLGIRRSIDPGSHLLQVNAEGFKPAEIHFDVADAGSATELVTLEAESVAAEPPPGAMSTSAVPTRTEPASTPAAASSGSSGGARAALPWVAFGLGGAGLAIGAVSGFLAMGKHSDLVSGGHCQGTTCDPSQQAALDSYHAMATVSTIGFVAGGVGVAAGVVLLVTQPKRESAGPSRPPQTGLRITPVVGVGSIGAVGQF